MGKIILYHGSPKKVVVLNSASARANTITEKVSI